MVGEKLEYQDLTEGQKGLTVTDELGNKIYFLMHLDGDITISTEGGDIVFITNSSKNSIVEFINQDLQA